MSERRRYTTSLAEQLAEAFDARAAELGLDGPEALRQAVSVWLAWSRAVTAPAPRVAHDTRPPEHAPPRVAHDTPPTLVEAPTRVAHDTRDLSATPADPLRVSPTTRPRHVETGTPFPTRARPEDQEIDDDRSSVRGWDEETDAREVWSTDRAEALAWKRVERESPAQLRKSGPVTNPETYWAAVERNLTDADVRATLARKRQALAAERSKAKAHEAKLERSRAELEHAEQLVAERPTDQRAQQRLERLREKLAQVDQGMGLSQAESGLGSTREVAPVGRPPSRAQIAEVGSRGGEHGSGEQGRHLPRRPTPRCPSQR